MFCLKAISRAALAVLVALALSGASVPGIAGTSGPDTQLVQTFDDTLLSVMKDAGNLGYDGRYKRLAPVIDQTFDIASMTRFVVGSTWNDWSQDQRNRVMEAFRRFIVATYARRFDGYDGETFKIAGSQQIGALTLVQTEMIRPNDTPIALNYLLRSTGDSGLKVVDIFLTGTISELATRKSEFSAVLDRDGYQGLVAALEKNTRE